MKIFLRARIIIYRKCPFKGQLSLAGYAQSTVPGELTTEIFSGHRNALADAFLKLCRFVFGLVELKT